MRALVQRVSRAAVRVVSNETGGTRTVGEIQRGFLVLLGLTHTDDESQVPWLADKIAGLRVFDDAQGKMNLALGDVGGAVLVVSQFTLYGDAAKGRRPSFVDAARPEQSEPLYQKFLAALRATGVGVAHGEFGARMEVELVNDGPVTIWLEK